MTSTARTQPALDEVVLRSRVDGDARVLRRDVIAPGLVDGAAHARDRAERGVREGLQASAALDVAPPDVQRHRVAVRNFGRAAADVGEAVDRQERVVAVDRSRVEEVAARGHLRDRLVVVEHELRVHVGVLAELVVTHRAEAVAAFRTLVMVERAEVVQVGARGIAERIRRAERIGGIHGIDVVREVRGEDAARVDRRSAAGEGSHRVPLTEQAE